MTPEEEIEDPYVLEFLGLKDEYSESDIEDALIRHLEAFLLELGGDFAFGGRQRRLIVLACKSDAIRCRVPGTHRELTLQTAVRDEVPAEIITVIPAKQWMHAGHPYVSGKVQKSHFDAAALDLGPLYPTEDSQLLDENKTDEPRQWSMADGTVEALRLYVSVTKDQAETVFPVLARCSSSRKGGSRERAP